MPPKLNPARPYSNFLTPLLHRQFIRAAVISFGACYIVSCLFVKNFSLGALQPISLAGIRSLVIFGEASLFVFIIRIWAFQAGRTTTKSPFDTLRLALFNKNWAPVNITFYLASAFFFGEIVVFSASEEARLWIVDQGGPADRPQVNERSILFRTQFLVLALVQSIYHIAYGVDEVKIPLKKSSALSSSARIKSTWKDALLRASVLSIAKPGVALIIGWISYYSIYRNFLWNRAFNTFKYSYDFPRNSAPRRSGVPAVLDLQAKFLYYAFLLTFIWEVSNYVFTEFIAEPPLKKKAPITADSKDPNGTLLLGLRTRRQLLKTFAFWELSMITSQFEGRRTAIYAELDRPNGSTWSQIYTLGISQLTGIQDRIKAFKQGDKKVAAPPPPAQVLSADGIEVPAVRDSGIMSPPIRPKTFSGKAAALAGDFAKGRGNQPGAVPPPHKLLEAGANRLLSREKVEQISPDAMYDRAGGILGDILNSWAATPFRQPFTRQVQSVICGYPTSRASIIVDAVSSLSALAVHSLNEDGPGQVQKSIGPLARTFAATITDVQTFIRSAPPHWTDVRFQSRHREVLADDVAAILVALKTGLEEILRAFGEYFEALGITKEEAKAWKLLVAKPQDPALPRPVTPERKTGR